MGIRIIRAISSSLPKDEVLSALCEPPLQIGEASYDKTEPITDGSYLLSAKCKPSFIKNSGIPQIVLQQREQEWQFVFIPAKIVIILFSVIAAMAALMELAMLVMMGMGQLSAPDWPFLLLPPAILLFGGFVVYTAFYLSSKAVWKEIKQRIK